MSERHIGNVKNKLTCKKKSENIHPNVISVMTSSKSNLIRIRCEGGVRWKLENRYAERQREFNNVID